MEKGLMTINKSDEEKTRSQECRHSSVLEEYPKFDSQKCESQFRRALKNVPSKSYINGEGAKLTLFIRPENLLEFGASVNRHGLEQCEATKKILRYLDRNKDEFLKFEHLTRN